MADGTAAAAARQRVTYVLPLPRELGGWRNSLGPQNYPLPPPTKTFAVPPRSSAKDPARLARRGPLLLPIRSPSDASADDDEEQGHGSGTNSDGTAGALDPPAHTRPHGPRSSQVHPRHMLPVTSLALDLTTCIESADDPASDLSPDLRPDQDDDYLDPSLGGGAASAHTQAPRRPRGLLYTAGRDALIASWQTDLPMTWTLGVRAEASQALYRPWRVAQPYWQLHPPDVPNTGLSASEHLLSRPTFRQGIQAHSEWINDLLLVNGNQTVISASSDRLIKAWNPHDKSSDSTSFTLGSHDDYVKTLAAPAWQLGAGQTQTIFSGGLDRTVKMWDVNATPSKQPAVSGGASGCGFGADDLSACQPVLSLTEADDELPSSVYSLSVDGRGSLIGVGCSANEVSVYDARSRVRVAKLVGHTGYVRSLLMSADGRHLLSASSDSTVRLWSIAEQRALHTFEHHSESVWALYSQDPYERDTLTSFYSADRAGDLCKVDWSDAPNIVSGECILLARNRPSMFNRRGSHVPIPIGTSAAKSGTSRHGPSHQGIHRIIAADDAFVFTASDTSSSVLAWPDVPKHKDRLAKYPSIAARAGSEGNVSSSWANQMRAAMQSNQASSADISSAVVMAGIPASSLVSLGDDQSIFDDRPADDGSSSLLERRPKSGGAQSTGRMALLRDVADVAMPLFTQPSARVSGGVGLIRSAMLNDRRHVLTMDTRGSVGIWDILLGVCLGFFERRALTQLALDEEALTGAPSLGPVQALSATGMTQDAITNLLTHSPADLLELIRERIEGSDAAPFWCTTDVRAGLLSVHLQSNKCFDAEMYIDDADFVNKDDYKEDTRINMGRWVLQNLFKRFIELEIRARSGARTSGPHGNTTFVPPTVTQSDVLAAEEPNAFFHHEELPKALAAPLGASLAIPPSGRAVVLSPGSDRGEPTKWSPCCPSGPLGVEVQMKALQQARVALTAQQSASQQAKIEAEHQHAATNSNANGSSSGGFMSRFKRKHKDKDKKTHTDAGAASQRAGASNEPVHVRQIREIVSRVALLSPPLPAGYGLTDIPASKAHPLLDLPQLPFPPGVMVLFGAISPQAGQALPAYRETMGRMAEDVPLLELVASPWLLANLLTPPPPAEPASTAAPTAVGIEDPAAYEAALQESNNLYRREVVKISFTLTSWRPVGSEEPADELALRNDLVLPELPASTTRLTATQMLRMKKVAGYVLDKLSTRQREVAAEAPHKGMPHAQATEQLIQTRFWSRLELPAEHEIVILCNETVVPPDMTLAQARRFLFRQSGDLKLEYRRAKPGEDPALAPVAPHIHATSPAAHHRGNNAHNAHEQAALPPDSTYLGRPSMADSYAPPSELDEGDETDSEADLESYGGAPASAPLQRLGYQ